MPKTGRRAEMLAQDTTPGKVLALAILANAPVGVAFVLAPLLAPGDRAATLAYLPFVLWLTPLFAIPSLIVFARAPSERKMHRAARMGALLAVIALVLWALVLGLTWLGPRQGAAL